MILNKWRGEQGIESKSKSIQNPFANQCEKSDDTVKNVLIWYNRFFGASVAGALTVLGEVE
jgi:hypothetical protein